ncbi:hypothetical protein [Streptacidiphilus sp. P02-A3a]|uniref:hypothetical protein n=1 Tax=Streptacidiphilus sp. P02-A3a TaxID=2704468 RepID=UPI0015FBF335|nr:hypothetical protein [Streptacidiphilus sp. P02-A3a]QMU71030.1 hypothetical protein GXP74_25210 [Streptacidiphilus sp. P02-A3a]
MSTETVRAATSADAYREGERLRHSAAVDHLESGYGGLNADVTDGDRLWQVWVGVNDRALSGECDCGGAPPRSLCAHAVATALAAVDAGTSWPSAPPSSPDDTPQDPAELRFLALAETLDPARLAALVARHAARDRLLAVDLEVVTGQLGAPTAEDLAPLRTLVGRADAIPGGDAEYDLHDLVTAARAALAELAVQAVRPPTLALLDAAEETVRCWDRLAAELSADWRTYHQEVHRIGAELADVHLDLCEQLQLDPLELADRLATVERAAESRDGNGASCLRPPAPYRSLLGADGLAGYQRLAAADRP